MWKQIHCVGGTSGGAMTIKVASHAFIDGGICGIACPVNVQSSDAMHAVDQRLRKDMKCWKW